MGDLMGNSMVNHYNEWKIHGNFSQNQRKFHRDIHPAGLLWQDMVAALRDVNGRYVGNRPVRLKKSNWKARCFG